MTKHIDARKLGKAAALSRSEKRAADTDSWVKKHLSEVRAADARKKSRLKALREARDAALPADEARPGSDHRSTAKRPC